MLCKPAASTADAAIRQWSGRIARTEVIHHAVNKSAAVTGPLHATIAHAGTRKAQAVLRRNAIFLKYSQHFPSDR
jgi:hypothetical protein